MRTLNWIGACANCLFVGTVGGIFIGAGLVLLGKYEATKEKEEDKPRNYYDHYRRTYNKKY